MRLVQLFIVVIIGEGKDSEHFCNYVVTKLGLIANGGFFLIFCEKMNIFEN